MEFDAATIPLRGLGSVNTRFIPSFSTTTKILYQNKEYDS